MELFNYLFIIKFKGLTFMDMKNAQALLARIFFYNKITYSTLLLYHLHEEILKVILKVIMRSLEYLSKKRKIVSVITFFYYYIYYS